LAGVDEHVICSNVKISIRRLKLGCDTLTPGLSPWSIMAIAVDSSSIILLGQWRNNIGRVTGADDEVAPPFAIRLFELTDPAHPERLLSRSDSAE
jgi:hypothetical protein